MLSLVGKPESEARREVIPIDPCRRLPRAKIPDEIKGAPANYDIGKKCLARFIQSDFGF